MLDAVRSPGSRIPLRRLAAVLGAWIVLAAGALTLASVLDSPVGEGARDEAQPAASGPVVAPPDRSVTTLPPFAIVLDHALPDGVAGLAPARQVETLRRRAMRTGSPERLVELGSVMQLLGDDRSAEFSYRSAVERDPESLAARVGLAMVGVSGADGLARASTRLRALAVAHPRSQLVAFNQGWVQLYRERGEAARTALRRTVALGPATRLGRTAGALLAALESIGFRPPPPSATSP